MRTEYQYRLDPSSRKFRCPGCGQLKFVRYIDTQTARYLPEQYGRCDREQRCGYHLNPYKDGYGREQSGRAWLPTRLQAPPPPPPADKLVHFPAATYSHFEGNRFWRSDFVMNLIRNVPYPFRASEVLEVAMLYRLGSVRQQTGEYDNAVCFPFIDTNGNIRAVQVKMFDKSSHTTATTFLHALLRKEYNRRGGDDGWLKEYEQQGKKITCLFGAHLLKLYPDNPVKLVEAPKTAIIGTLCYGIPAESKNNPVWVAVYNKSSFTYDKMKDLAGRDVEVFPDLSEVTDGSGNGATFQEWKRKAEEIMRQNPSLSFRFNDYLERVATDEQRAAGLDLADFLLNEDRKSPAPDSVEVQQIKTPPPPIQGREEAAKKSTLTESQQREKGETNPERTPKRSDKIDTLSAWLALWGFPDDWEPNHRKAARATQLFPF